MTTPAHRFSLGDQVRWQAHPDLAGIVVRQLTDADTVHPFISGVGYEVEFTYRLLSRHELEGELHAWYTERRKSGIELLDESVLVPA